MSRESNEVTINPARNGYYITIGQRRPNVEVQPSFVFESFEGLVSWLKVNYCDGEQPSNNGA